MSSLQASVLQLLQCTILGCQYDKSQSQAVYSRQQYTRPSRTLRGAVPSKQKHEVAVCAPGQLPRTVTFSVRYSKNPFLSWRQLSALLDGVPRCTNRLRPLKEGADAIVYAGSCLLSPQVSSMMLSMARNRNCGAAWHLRTRVELF